ncbi:hypothetical protein HOH45_08695 [bacterium]|jgi:hypothetical protein|nr:hypothetical protein [bacterium]
MSGIDSFNKPKPPSIPLQMDARVKNVWKIGLADEFGKRLADIVAKEDSFKQLNLMKSSDPFFNLNSKLSKSDYSAMKTSASIKATRQISNFQKLLDFMPRAKLAFLDQTGDKYNNELVKSANYTDYRFALNSAFWNPKKVLFKESKNKNKVKTDKFGLFFDEDGHPSDEFGIMEPTPDNYLLDDVYGQTNEELYGETYEKGFFAAQGNTWSHNLNLYHGAASWNPFKKEGGDYDVFESSDALKPLNERFASPLEAIGNMDSSVWESSNTWLQKIQEMKRIGKTGNLTKFENVHNKEDMDNDLNWEGAADPYKDNGDIKTFDINANFYTLGMSEIWRTFGEEEAFSFLLLGYESKKRGISAYKDIIGRVYDLPNQYGTEEAQLSKVDGVVENSKQWWEEIGQHLNNKAMMIPFGSLPAMASSVSKMMDTWNEWGESDITGAAAPISQNMDFKDKMIGDYLSHIDTNLISKKLKGLGVMDTDELNGIGGLSGSEWKSTLVEHGYLTGNGTIGSSFSFLDPNFRFSVGKPVSAEKIVFDKLKVAANGAFGIESLDRSTVGGENRKNMKLQGPDGQKFRLEEILDFVNMGSTSIEKYETARYAYNVAFDIFESMTGIDLESKGGNGRVQGTKTGNQFEVKVYPKASWTEWNLEKERIVQDASLIPPEGSGEEVPAEAYKYNAGWEDKEAQPLFTTFGSEEEAQTFLNNIRSFIAALEPVVGGFDPTNAGGPGHAADTYEGGVYNRTNLRVLIDNAGSIESTEFITSEHDLYRLQVDFLPHYNNEGVMEDPENDYTGIRGFDRFFSTGGESWGKQINTYIQQKAAFGIGKEVFEIGTMNSMSRLNWRKKKDTWYDEKDEFDRIKREEKRAASKIKGRLKRAEKLSAKKAKQSRIRIENASKKSANKRKAEQAKSKSRKK